MITLEPHQFEAVEAFKAKGGRMLLWGHGGIGKTFIALECIKRVLAKHGHDADVLILCPAGEMPEQWKSEIARYFPVVPPNLFVTNYEKLLNADYRKAHLNRRWLMVVADECQYVSSPVAHRTKLFKKLKSAYCLPMSATPAPNALHELWSVMDYIKPGLLGSSFYSFKQYDCITNFFGGITGYKDEEALRRKIAPFIHRIEGDVLDDLPALTTEEIDDIELTPDHRADYDALRKDYQLRTATEHITIPNAVAMISRLRQMVDCPSVFGLPYESPKMRAIRELFVYTKDPTLIFVEHQESARVLCEMLGCPGITGATPAAARHKIVADFQAGKFDVLVGSYAMGVGLNLQRATRVINYSQYWNPSRMDQTVWRAHRKGQTEEVLQLVLIAQNTIDEKIARIIEKKRGFEAKFTKSEILSLLD